MDSAILKSHAKLNLCLWVYPLLPGNQNFHPICGIFQTISLHDTLHVRTLSEKQCKIICDSSEIPVNHDNDIAKAFSKLQGRLKIGVEVTLTKRIPVGAGLGGGSSNAATLLQFLNPLCEPEYSFSELHKIASEIGSDVPYFLHGGTCFVTTGPGVNVSPLQEMQTKWFLLIYPNIKSSTVLVYNEFDRHKNQKRDLADSFPDLENNFGENDLKQAALELYPDLQKVHGKLSEMNLGDVHMTGSGSTLYIPVLGKEEGVQLQHIVHRHIGGVWTCVTRTQSLSHQPEQ